MDIPSPIAHKTPDTNPGAIVEGKTSGLFFL